MKKKLIFFEIGYYNIFLCYICSFFFDIKAFRFQNARVKKVLKNASLIEYDQLVNRDEIQVLKTRVVESWFEMAKTIRRPDVFKYHLPGLEFSAVDKAWKDYAYIYEQYEVVRTLKHKFQLNDWVLIEHADLFLLKKYYGFKPEASENPAAKLINCLNIFCGSIKFQFYRIAALFSQTAYIVKMALGKKKKDVSAKIIWSAISPHELSSPIESSNALWLMNHTNMKAGEILYMHPAKKIFINEPVDQPANYFYSVFQLMASLPFSLRLKALIFTLKNFVLSFFFFPFFSEKLNTLYREQELYCWKLVVEHLKIHTSVNSVSESLHSNHMVLLFNKLGLRTVFYLYSANSFFITSFNRHRLLHLSYAKLLNNTIVVWHEKYKEVFLRDYGVTAEIKVLGPLMATKEYLSTENVQELREKYINQGDRRYTYLSIYDVSPQMKNINQGLTSFFPYIYNEEFCTRFLEDIDRLFHELDDLVIIYKPKRNNKSKLFPLPEKMSSILENNSKNSRWINLTNSINPWIPILMADINIGIPFTSTCFAALCKGKQFLFHNPDDMAKFHEYSDIQNSISNNYDELKEKVLALKNGSSNGDLKTSKYYVPEPPKGFSQAFADFLRAKK